MKEDARLGTKEPPPYMGEGSGVLVMIFRTGMVEAHVGGWSRGAPHVRILLLGENHHTAPIFDSSWTTFTNCTTMLGPPTSPIARPRPPSQSRRSSGMSAPNTPARLRTQSHTPARTHRSLLSPTDAELAPPPYSKENTQQRPNPRHSLTEIDDMLNVAGSVVRNRERVPVIDNLLFIALITTCIVELDAAALASRSLLEENKLMFAKREALLARLPISNRNSLSSTPPPERQHSNRSSSWSTCSDESDNDNSTATATPFRDMSIPLPIDPLEAHRVITPSHSASNSIDISAVVASSSPFEPPAARLAPTQAERIAALHAGLVSPPRLILQGQDRHLPGALGEAEKANEGLRTEAEKEKEKQRVRAQSAGPRPSRREKSIEEKEEGVKDFAPSATWRPEFRSLRGGSVRPAVPARSATTSSTVSRGPRAGGGPVRAQTSIGAPTPASTPVRAGRAQSSLSPPPTRNSPTSPLRHAPIRPSGLRHQRSNSFAGLGKSFQASLEEARRAVATIEEGATDAETGGTSPKAGVNPKLASKPSSTRSGAAAVMFPTFSDEEVKMDAEQGQDMSPSATRVLAQELVAKINELRATNEEVQQQRDNLKQMLETAQAEADDLKRVCERLEHEVEVERSGSGGGSDGETRAPRPERPGLQLNIPPLEVGEPEPPELGAELQDDKNATDAAPAVPAAVDLASELMNASMTMSKPSTPTSTVFGIAPRSRRPSISVKPPASTKRALGGRGLATRAKTNPRRPVSSPTAADAPVTPAKNKEEAEEEFLTPRTEFVTPLMTPMNVTIHQQEVYLTPASTLRVPGGLSALAVASPVTDDEDAPEPGPSKSKEDGTMAQLRAALDPLFSGVIQGQGGLAAPQPSHAIRRKQSQLRLLLSKDEPLEPWETKIRDLYSEIKAFEQEDPGMSSAGEDSRKFSRRARALGRMSLRRRVTGAEDYASDYAADDSEVGDRVVSRRQEEEQKRLAGFQLARKFQQKSMSTFLEVLLLVQFAVVLVVFVYTAVRRGPKAVLGNKRVR
ncbi:IncA domain-containing protein [Rhizoctonia solani]|uniref:IncA domain-containing protein n=1 Tax=Rhizoctonia solani TaxID=456999 RepID=A0A8H8NL60_9AGAM|nr:IncA domain-containing protein [Rhizoctonia solani]QRW15754.1 IncA domain-containing protein [Rhizoctonia solani]